MLDSLFLNLEASPILCVYPEYEFNEFKPRLKSVKNWFQLSAGLNIEKLNTILSGTSHI